jgi:hypothetical protein
MPQNNVSDPITDQEIAFVHLILSGTMSDRRAAEGAGLNPETAAYLKSTPRVSAYMTEHSAAAREKPVDQEADLPQRAVGPAVESPHKFNIGRGQILTRLWELATLSHEVTRGSIAGQIKAMTMIVAIEGLIPSRTNNDRRTQPAAPPLEPDIYKAEWLRKQEHQPVGAEPGDSVADTEAQPAAPQVHEPEPAPNPVMAAPPPPPHPTQPSLPDPMIPQGVNWVPLATGRGFNALLDSTNSRQPFSIKKGRFGRRGR